MSKTHAEIRNENLDRELFTITDEMKKAMKAARIEKIKKLSEIAKKPTPAINNFRAYDQDQDFFVVVSKNKFLAAEHSAAIVDAIIERLDLSKIYEVYSLEGNPPFHPKMMLKI